MSAYTADGKRRSSQTHARRNYLCDVCGVYSSGNGGTVAHARSHVRSGEVVELVKWHSMLPSPTRVFLPVDEVDRIAAFAADGFEKHGKEVK